MEEVKNRLAQLFDKEKWTDDEKQWLLHYLEDTDSVELRSILFREFNRREQATTLNEQAANSILRSIHKKIGAVQPSLNRRVISFSYKKLAAAAVIILGILSAYLVTDNRRQKNIAALHVQNKPVNNTQLHDIAPGSNKAVLTLADGSTVVLDDAKNGSIAQQGKTTIVKINGRLTYNAAGANNQDVFYNTISTPRGGAFQVLLPDGSNVWLNAASSLKFPTSFKGNERRVEITGEAYFEVAKNPAMPFIVKINDAEVKVLGTHFNIAGYGEDASVKTTLLEGSVQFSSGNQQTKLSPGQQSELVNGQVKVLNGINLEATVAWKNGMFHFQKTGVETMMRQIARWYDVEIVYTGRKTDEEFYAEISRDSNLSDVLKILEFTNKIHFTVVGKKVFVR